MVGGLRLGHLYRGATELCVITSNSSFEFVNKEEF